MEAKSVSEKTALFRILSNAINIRSLLLTFVGLLVLFTVFYGAVAALRALEADREANLQVDLSAAVNSLTEAQLE